MKITHKMTATDKLREILRIRNWKQKDLAGKLGVSEKTVSFWVNGRKQPSAVNEDAINHLYVGLYNDEASNSVVQRTIQDYQSKSELNEDEKVFSDTERIYFDAKSYVLESEKNNRRYVYLFPSISKIPDAWYKVGGKSLLFYKNLLAPRLSREARIRDDTDKAYRFRHGIVSVKRGSNFMSEAEELGYKAKRVEYGIIVIDLMRDFTDIEIHDMVRVVREERNRPKKLVKPKENYPAIVMAMNDLVRVLPSKIKKLDKDYKMVLGKELLEPMSEMLKIYFRMANGRMEKRDAKLEMMERTDDIAAMIYLMDEAQMLNVSARTAMGENVVKIRRAIEESL